MSTEAQAVQELEEDGYFIIIKGWARKNVGFGMKRGSGLIGMNAENDRRRLGGQPFRTPRRVEMSYGLGYEGPQRSPLTVNGAN